MRFGILSTKAKISSSVILSHSSKIALFISPIPLGLGDHWLSLFLRRFQTFLMGLRSGEDGGHKRKHPVEILVLLCKVCAISRNPILHDPKWCALCLALPVPKGLENRVEDMIDVGCCGNDTQIVLISKGNRGLFSANNPPLNHDRVLLFELGSNPVLKTVLSWLLCD